jgi:PHP-associated
MTLPRPIGLALVFAGIVWGTLHDRSPLREIPRVDGRFLIAGDFHVHAFIGDGGLAPWELRREARRRELDVIAVTNHNQRLAAVLATRSARHAVSGDPIVLAGQEVTAPQYHLVAVGVRDTIDWRLGASDAIRAVQSQGGIAIAAHPTPDSWRARDADALSLLDGLEIAPPGASNIARGRRDLARLFQAASAHNPTLAPIGSSDFHFGGSLGLCRTYLFVDEISERGVLDAIRDGRTVAYDARGRLSGDPARVQAVRALVALHPPPLQADLESRAASWLSLAGLLILLCFR